MLQKELDERGFDFTILGEYINSHAKIRYRCNTCGNEHEASPTLLLCGRGCPDCGRKKNTKERTKTKEQFSKEISELQPNIEVIGEYVNTHVPIMCRCNIDGFEWESYPANLLNLSAGCPICKNRISRGEQAIMKCLDNIGISYIRNHAFEDCRRVSVLRFDFYIPEYNMAIEFDGRQHFMEIPRFTGSGGFELTKERDQIKNQYCLDNGIKMIRIPYYEYDNIDNIIIELFKNTA